MIKYFNGFYGWVNPPEPAKAKATKKKEANCTCGVKFTGGLCSDWCDTNNPPPDTEELPF